MRRKRKGKDPEEVSFWQSYSDMMAALLLVFVLIIAVANYSNVVTNNKLNEQISQYMAATEENDNLSQQIEEDNLSMAEQQAKLDEQAATLAEQQASLEEQATTLAEQAATLAEQETELSEQKETMATQQATLDEQAQTLADQQTTLDEQAATLAEQETELSEAKETMATQQATLDEQAQTMATQQATLDEQAQTMADQQATMEEQQASLEKIIGVRAELIETLKTDFEGSNLDISVDAETGAISFASNILFDYGETVLKDSGKEFLNEFFPKYFDVILSDEFAPYISEVIIEGHTDQHGSYLVNLEISQGRAYAVAAYCLGEDSSMFTADELAEIRKLVTANGRSSNDLIYEDEAQTIIDEDASRRVEIKFRLTEEEMIQEMSDILDEE